MFMEDLGTLVLTGKSGRLYTFKIYQFGTMEALDDAIKDFHQAGLFVFASKQMKPKDDSDWFIINYIGETEDYSKRDYRNPHKKDVIVLDKSNTWGFCILSVAEEERKEIATDLIDNYFPSCNG